MHLLAVTDKRGSFRAWTVLLAICAFSLSLLGTFLVRSEVFTSVHAFASDPTRGIFILVFPSIVTGGALTLFAWRAPKIGLGPGFALVSRESLLLSNNVLLIVAAAFVLLGTLYSLLLDVLGLGKISVGTPPYFDTVFVPLMVPAVFLMGIGPIARWKSARLPDIAVRLCWATLVSVASAAALPWLAGEWKSLVALGMLLAVWCATTMLTALAGRIGEQRGPWILRFFHVPRGFYGMLVAHFGIGIFIAGVTLVKGDETAGDARLDTGQSIEAGGYSFRFDGTKEISGPNYRALRANVIVSREGRVVALMHPEKRFFPVQKTTMTEAAVNRGLFRDLYVALGDAAENSNTAWTVRVQIKPFVDWIWAGCLLMAFGGVLAASDRRHRLAVREKRDKQELASSAVRARIRTQAVIATANVKETGS